ncbi:MAG: ureidoglycolate lyase [Microcoleaceae cyanobacterium]
MNQSIIVKQLFAQEITQDNFRPFGQVIWTAGDHKQYDQDDAQLNLENGTPRFYIMRLKKRSRKFTKITRHIECTQCLGSLEGKEWLMAVAPPCAEDAPKLEDVVAFNIPGNCFIKLEMGTWHAGPYSDYEFVDFYNLELSNTNEVDHFSHDFYKSHNLELEIV